MTAPLSHLKSLESESIEIFREVSRHNSWRQLKRLIARIGG